MDEAALTGMMLAAKLGFPLRVGGQLVSVSAEEAVAIEARLPPAPAGPASAGEADSDLHLARDLAFLITCAERALTELAGRAGTLAWPPGVAVREERGYVLLTEPDGRRSWWGSWFEAWRSMSAPAQPLQGGEREHMAETAATEEPNGTRGRPFKKGQSGNPAGRPPGTRHKVTLAAEALLDGESEALTRKAIELALTGDTTALRLCLERILPPRKSRKVAVQLPAIEKAEDLLPAFGAVVAAMAEGDLTLDEATAVVGLLEMKRKALETVELERRLVALEQRAGEKR